MTRYTAVFHMPALGRANVDITVIPGSTWGSEMYAFAAVQEAKNIYVTRARNMGFRPALNLMRLTQLCRWDNDNTVYVLK